MKKITDKDFRYVPSHSTDVAKTIRKELERRKKEQEAREHATVNIFRVKAQR